MKRFISILLSLAMIVSLMPTLAFAEDTPTMQEPQEGYEITLEETVEELANDASMIQLLSEDYSSNISDNEADVIRYTVLALDTSGSMRGAPMTAAKAAAIKFCSDILAANGHNYVALITLNSSSSVVCDFTDDIATVTGKINNLYASGGTNVNDALIKANNILSSIQEGNSLIKNIVLLSDGLPESGAYSYDGAYTSSDYYYYEYANTAYATAQILKSNYFIYSLGFFHDLSGSELAFGRRFMSDLQNSGYYDVTDVDDLEFQFGNIADDIKQDNTNCPIIVVPGVMGSRLFDDEDCKYQLWDPSANDLLWDSYFFTTFGSKMNYSNELYVNDVKVNQNATKEREYGAQSTYKKLVDSLCEKYPNREIYFFSYDFRDSNDISATKLNELISYALSINQKSTKVDIICHSMGGLVSSSYVKQYGSEKINHIITLGTPYEGAPKLVNAVLNWDALTNKYEDDDLLNSFNMSTISDSVLGLAGLTKSVKAGFPSIAQLAPTETLFDKYYYYKRHRDGFLWLTTTDTSISYQEYSSIMNNIFGNNFTNAINFHNGIKNEDGVNLLYSLDNSYFIIGINQPTIGALVFNEGDSLGSLECVDLMYEYEGDGTVPYYSASIDKNVDGLDSSRYLKVNDTHTGIVSNDKSIEYIDKILSKTDTNVENDNIEGRKYVVVRIACPVDVEIERNGEILSSDMSDASFNASYGCVDFLGSDSDIKMMCLRADQIDNLHLTGTGEGMMNLTMRWFDETNHMFDERAFNDIALNENMIMTTNTDNTTATVLSIDVDGDGTVDETVEATENSTISSNVAIPSVSKDGGTYTSNINVELFAEEGAAIYYTLNGETPNNTSSLYTEAISITKTMTLKAVAYKDNMYSNVLTKTYIISKRTSSGGGTSLYTIEFETNGGNEISNKSVRRNSTLTEPTAPTKDGFTFEGWYTDKEYTKAYDFSVKVTRNFTLYAKWEDIKKSQIILTIGDKKVLLFGEKKENDVAPKIVNDRTMLPIRFVAESLGAEVIWTEAEPNKVVIKKDSNKIVINIGSDEALVGNKKVELDSPAFIENDRTYLPLRFVSENLGAKVEWVEDTQQVIILK